ncbi:MAG: hypothetical protein JWO81_1677 [Alphaproteobacteria bacterium]|nr:hypothetical protein [Alphaproteobacteria bacterium]
MQRANGYNPKRRIAPADRWSEAERKKRARSAGYGGNPEHKKYANDYELDPPTAPRPGKTLCDGNGPHPKADALRALAAGLRRGMTSVQMRSNWPQNVWSVVKGVPFEAELEDRERGIYHGYPMPEDDTFRQVVLREWSERA